jgi:hypothetical protein
VTLFELHLILGQSARLIREDKFDLAKLLNQVRVATQCILHILCKEHLNICIYQLCLPQL